MVATVHAVIGLAEITVIAPTTQQTARGRSLQGNHADFLHPIRLPDLPDTVKAYHFNASPALAVRHGPAALFSERHPDLLLSGINYGENVGGNITVPGTIGAAIQAAAHGIPAIAASRQTGIEYHYEYGVLDWKDAIRVTI